MEETEPGKPAPGSSQRRGREKGYFLSESSSRAMDAVGFLRGRERGVRVPLGRLRSSSGSRASV